MDDLEGSTSASGDASDHGGATDMGAVSVCDITQATPQGLAPFPSTDTAAERARRDADTGHLLAAVTSTAQQTAPQAPPIDSLFAQGGKT
jgi:hypothetical protein